MKKFYIPTSTFNFNNILSSESVSPKAFYLQRGFGYSHWLSIPQNCNDNAIILYDKPFCFTRPTSDIEDHPLLIEILTDENFNLIDDGIFYCDHTLYLSPWNTRFIFFTEKDLNVTLSLSDSSLETKMLRLYRKKLFIEQYDAIEYPNINKNIALNEQAIKEDRKINKMKGLLYGYYIGALLSVTSEIVRRHNMLHELENIFSAILSSENRTPTMAQESQIRSILFAMQKDENPVVIYLEKQLADPQKLSEVLINLLKLGVVFPGIISADNLISDLCHFSDGKDNRAIIWLENEKHSLQYRNNEHRILLHPDKEDIIINNGSVVKIAEDVLGNGIQLELTKAWVNDTLLSDKYNGKISPLKLDLADDVTFKAKEVYKEQWINSEAKISLNNMRRYINGIESDFNWKNLLVSSIAAVIAKGNDWNYLLAFMQSKNICDYRLAFAFYGELNGFANLTRDFTDILLNEDNKYVATVYKEFYGQLLGIDLNAIDYSSFDNSKNSDNVQKNISINSNWKQNARIYIENHVSLKKNRDKAIELLNDSLITTEEQFLTKLTTCKGWTKGKNIKGIKEYLRSNTSMFPSFVSNYDSEIKSNLINHEDRNLSMFSDKSWWDETANMIHDSKIREQYLCDVEWFVGNHEEFYKDKKKGLIKGVYYNKQTDNLRFLERFCAYLQNKLKLNSKAPWIAGIYAQVPVNDIVKYLTLHYAKSKTNYNN